MIYLNRTLDSEPLFPQLNSALESSSELRRREKLTSRSRAWMGAFLALGTGFSLDAHADYWFRVSDTSQIQYLVGSPQICLRNLNTLRQHCLGLLLQLLDRHFIKPTSGGKAAWATLLARMVSQQPVCIYISSQIAPGAATVTWFG
jgi:hypothetical protein